MNATGQNIVTPEICLATCVENILSEILENRLFLKYKIKQVEGFVPLKTYLLEFQRAHQTTIAELTLIIDNSIHTIPEYFFSGLETLEIQKV